MINKKIGIIGCGNMGEALLSRLVNVVEKSTSLMVSEMDAKRRDRLHSKYRMIIEIDNNIVVKYSDVIILAIKPQDVETVLQQEVCCGVSEKKLIISIAAGITTKYIEKLVGKDVPVIRVMPNMPAIVGEAISSISAGSAATKEDVALAKEIFSMLGDVVEVDEKLVDSVTAISGSGPAYFFYLAECLIAAANKIGIKGDLAEKLVVKTALGSAKLVHELDGNHTDLRQRVTSKGGTTEAAFKVFASRKFKKTVEDAVKAAAKRSKELSKG